MDPMTFHRFFSADGASAPANLVVIDKFTTNVTTGSAPTITYPTGIQAGDLLVFSEGVTLANSTDPMVTLPGFTLGRKHVTATTYNVFGNNFFVLVDVQFKIATGTETGTISTTGSTKTGFGTGSNSVMYLIKRTSGIVNSATVAVSNSIDSGNAVSLTVATTGVMGTGLLLNVLCASGFNTIGAVTSTPPYTTVGSASAYFKMYITEHQGPGPITQNSTISMPDAGYYNVINGVFLTIT